jgi:hypothetical protein
VTKIIPLGFTKPRQILNDREILRSGAIGLPREGLHLQEGKIRIEFDRVMRTRQAHIDEKRAEPVAGFDNALIAFIAAIAHKIGRRANQCGPARGGAHCKAAPDLYQAWFDEGAEEGGRIALDIFRRGIIDEAGGWERCVEEDGRTIGGDDEVLRQIRITILHEIGHHFGLSEEDLAALGYE